ncbi:MAG TPA: 3-hydroxybutyrate oligomer hydrolase family protein [Xanthomonadaceae bacterium]|nr:3-hydroxybutyrate oligomer hydrolase family protein [Xanthomonadaceae bacterium]
MRRRVMLCITLLLVGCGREAPPERVAATMETPMPDFLVSAIRETRHVGDDDLLSAGLGLDGLRGPAPLPADVTAPTAQELRRLAIHTNWRGIADLSPLGGFGEAYGAVPDMPGREYSAFAHVPGARHPHRVLMQVPDAFDHDRRCLIVAPASGSRGVYGAIALAGAFGLPRGCAIAYTDKGAGTDYFDFASDSGVRLDGTRGGRGDGLAFEPDAIEGDVPLVAMKHAHSGDHPEADWGRHTLQAAQFGLEALNRAFPGQAPFTADNTVIVAAAVSNGAGAVLRGLELDDQSLFDAALAAAPNITVAGAPPLYEVATFAALYQVCLLADDAFRAEVPLGNANPLVAAGAALRCTSLQGAGLLAPGTPAEAAAEARRRLIDFGFSEAALRQAAVNAAFDLWRAVGVTYASSYLRRGAADMPCDFALAAVDATGQPRAATATERALWSANSAGVAPAAEIGIVDRRFALPDPFLPGVQCLRALWDGESAESAALRAAIDATHASARLPDIPLLILHGGADGLVPVEFTSRPYVAAARAHGAARLAYWEMAHVQHFDAFMAVPDFQRDYLPMMPYIFAGLERLFAHLFEDAPAPADASIAATPRPGETLTREALGLPE